MQSLHQRESEARNLAVAKGLEREYDVFAEELEKSGVVVALPALVALQMVVDVRRVFVNYEMLVDSGTRASAEIIHDRQRRSVVGLLFGTYGHDIRYGTLSLGSNALATYGDVSCRLREMAIRKRVSFLHENSYSFVTRHNLRPGMPLPKGFRADWGGRCRLALAKLAPELKKGSGPNERAALLVRSDGTNRANDDFIEAHIFRGFSVEAVEEMVAIPTEKRGELDQLLVEAALQLFRKSGGMS